MIRSPFTEKIELRFARKKWVYLSPEMGKRGWIFLDKHTTPFSVFQTG
jgi:hypothetical protein